MKLTGKCKEDFKKWLKELKYNSKASLNKYYKELQDLPQSMQYGIYVDFFDSVKMQIYIKPIPSGRKYLIGRWSVYIDYFGSHILSEYIYKDTRQEARTKAIEKANEIYNKQ